jgi:hypothetical protein
MPRRDHRPHKLTVVMPGIRRAQETRPPPAGQCGSGESQVKAKPRLLLRPALDVQ